IVIEQFEEYIKVNKKLPTDLLNNLKSSTDPVKISDLISVNLGISLEQKQELLELNDPEKRLDKIYSYLLSEIDSFQVEKKIKGRVKRQMEKTQKEYYLNEQMKAIQKELGEMDDAPNEIDELQNRIATAKMSDEAIDKANSELNKLKMMSPMSAEASVVRSYIEWLVGVPWAKRSKVKHDIKRAQLVLDQDHYGLEEVKDRILEYLAVQKRVRKLKGPVLCLVGPPGVGKTSLGESIARSTNRKFVRMALGGVRDEAE
ncbi:MAG TPA: endopeptidase La, partial [Verrucomicrobiales bacterium]|nr:endopeptidase La [Verrucomicrobiales bacterium]